MKHAQLVGAVCCGDLMKVTHLPVRQDGVNPQHSYLFGAVPLHAAALRNKTFILHFLLALCLVDVNKTSLSDKTALLLVAGSFHPEGAASVEILLTNRPQHFL